jgi:hypothetical protein
MPNMNSERLGHLIRFYSIIEKLESNIGGAKKLTDCSGRMSWPKRGVYFFREPWNARPQVWFGNEAVGTSFSAQGAASERRRQSQRFHFQAHRRRVPDQPR